MSQLATTTPPATDAPAPPAGAARPGLLDGLGDRLNPILVKEVRQSLQGKFFRWMFLITLVTATVVASAMILLAEDVTSLSGTRFFVPIYACLSAAVHVFVPFAVFTSLGGEWEENTYDLLVISGLRPRQIALGKLLSATTHVVLYYSAFGPFLVFAFLLKGLDLTAVAVILGGTLLTTTLLSSIALGFSSLSRHRVVRVLLLTFLAGGFVQSTVGSVGAALGIIRASGSLHDPEARTAFLGFATAAVLLSAFFFAVACARLAHPEENRSTALRVLALAVVASGVAWLLHFLFSVFPLSPGDLQEVMPVMLLPSLLVLLVPTLFFVTEPERLGRRVRHTVPRSRLLALLTAPFLPGGGRGFLLLLLEIGALAVVGFRARLSDPAAEAFANSSDRAFVAGLCYAIVYLGVPSALLAKREHHLPRLVLARLSVPVLLVLGAFLPSLVAFFLGVPGVRSFEHLGVPPWVVVELAKWNPEGGSDGDGALVALLVLAGVTVLLNAPRMFRGVREVLAAAADRRARERSAPAGAPSDAASAA